MQIHDRTPSSEQDSYHMAVGVAGLYNGVAICINTGVNPIVEAIEDCRAALEVAILRCFDWKPMWWSVIL